MAAWRKSLLWVVLLTSALAAALLIDASPEGATLAGIGGPGCTVRDFTGHDCPGCGLTRATACVVQGRWSDAWRFHPAGYLIAAMIICGILIHSSALRASILRRRDPENDPREEGNGQHLASIAARWGLALCCLLVWLGRLVGVFPSAGSTH